MTRAETLRATAASLRSAPNGLATSSEDVITVGGEHIGGCPDCRVAPEMDSPQLLVGLLNARAPLSDLLETVADLIDARPELERSHVSGGPCDDLACQIVHLALATAAILGGEA